MHRLGNHAPHGITPGDEPADVEGFCQRGNIVSAILEPEPRTQADPSPCPRRSAATTRK